MPLYDSICKDHQQDVCLIAKDLVFSMVECWEWIEECHSWRKEAPLQSGCLAADTSALPDSRRTTVLKRFCIDLATQVYQNIFFCQRAELICFVDYDYFPHAHCSDDAEVIYYTAPPSVCVKYCTFYPTQASSLASSLLPSWFLKPEVTIFGWEGEAGKDFLIWLNWIDWIWLRTWGHAVVVIRQFQGNHALNTLLHRPFYS